MELAHDLRLNSSPAYQPVPLRIRGLGVGRVCLKVFLVGCGGTGSKLMPELCQALALLRQELLPLDLFLTLVDGDVVEEHNLVRQHFVPADLGRPKAQVLAERYSAAFGLDISYRVEYLESQETLRGLLEPVSSSGYHITLLITAVDNARTRVQVAATLGQPVVLPLVWIDLGNDALSGQVVVGTYPDRYLFHLVQPDVVEVFPELRTAAEQERRVCGQGGLQDLNINAVAATHAATYIRKLLRALARSQRERVTATVADYHWVEFGLQPPSALAHYNLPAKLLAYRYHDLTGLQQNRGLLQRRSMAAAISLMQEALGHQPDIISADTRIWCRRCRAVFQLASDPQQVPLSLEDFRELCLYASLD